MNAVTLRNIPTGVAQLIQHVSKAKGLSLNKTIVSLLEGAAGLQHKKNDRVVYNDLDALAGSWKKEEAKTFELILARQRGIDPSLWK